MNTQTAERRGSEALYDEISKSRNSIRRENIRLIRDVCDQMEKDKVQITAAEVVRRCGEDGPSYSTVCNKGSLLGDYVRLRTVEQGARRSNKNGRESIADTVADPVLQAQIREKEEAARWLSRENMGLRKLFKALRPGVDIDQILESARDGMPLQDSASATGSEGDPDVGAALIKLMAHLINERNYGELRGRFAINGKVILSSEEFAAVRRGTGLSDEQWAMRFQGGKVGA
jgi:hypothetical protein